MVMNRLLFILILISSFASCRKSDSCYNGVLDKNEEGVDCGGPCFRCIPDSVYGLGSPTRLEQRLTGIWYRQFYDAGQDQYFIPHDSSRYELSIDSYQSGLQCVIRHNDHIDTIPWNAIAGQLTLGSNVYQINQLDSTKLVIKLNNLDEQHFQR